ncbi:hypothetical protein FB107DRAFT_249266 [Schizophyllum commune]
MSASEDAPAWDLLPHIHSSPCWASSATQYLIPLLVPVHTEDLKPYYNKGLDQNMYDAGNCAYINEESLCELTRLHRIIRARQSLLLSRGPSAQEAVQDFLREIGPDSCPESMRTGPSIPSTEGQLKPPRAPARPVQPNISYSSIAKRATQSGASTHPTASTRPKPERQATIRPERPATVRPERQETGRPERQATIRPERQETGRPERQATLMPERRKEPETKPVAGVKVNSTKAEEGQMAPAPAVKQRSPSVKSNASSSIRKWFDTPKRKLNDGLEGFPPARLFWRSDTAKLPLYEVPFSFGQLYFSVVGIRRIALPGMPLRRGNIVWICAHFLAALKPLLKETDLGPADVVDLTRLSSTAPPSMRKNARPCIIWNLENERDGTVDVLLAGTYERTTYTNLPRELKRWVIGLFNESAIEDWMTIDHVHASPEWRKTATSWIIPLSVTVPTSALKRDAYCKYINDASMSKLASFHAAMRVRYDSVLLQSPTRKVVARSLLDHSHIRNIMDKESPLYDAPSAVAGSSRYRPGQFSISSVPAPGDMHPPQKRRRYKGPEPPEQSHGAERGGTGADGRGGGSASSRRGASRSRGHGMYHRPADGGSAPSLNRKLAGHYGDSSRPLLSSQSSTSSLSSRSSQVSHTPSTSSYYTARSAFSDSSGRSRHVSDVSSELAFWSGSDFRESARARQELDALERRGSSVRAEKRKRSPPRTPTAPRAMREAWSQTPVASEVPPLSHPSFASLRPEALHLTLPERPQKPIAQAQQPFAPPETPRKTRAEAALLASFKKLSPPSLKNFGRRRSKENAEVRRFFFSQRLLCAALVVFMSLTTCADPDEGARRPAVTQGAQSPALVPCEQPLLLLEAEQHSLFAQDRQEGIGPDVAAQQGRTSPTRRRWHSWQSPGVQGAVGGWTRLRFFILEHAAGRLLFDPQREGKRRLDNKEDRVRVDEVHESSVEWPELPKRVVPEYEWSTEESCTRLPPKVTCRREPEEVEPPDVEPPDREPAGIEVEPPDMELLGLKLRGGLLSMMRVAARNFLKRETFWRRGVKLREMEWRRAGRLLGMGSDRTTLAWSASSTGVRYPGGSREIMLGEEVGESVSRVGDVRGEYASEDGDREPHLDGNVDHLEGEGDEADECASDEDQVLDSLEKEASIVVGGDRVKRVDECLGTSIGKSGASATGGRRRGQEPSSWTRTVVVDKNRRRGQDQPASAQKPTTPGPMQRVIDDVKYVRHAHSRVVSAATFRARNFIAEEGGTRG